MPLPAAPPPQLVSVAAAQFACSADRAANEDRAERAVRKAAAAGANVVLLQELFSDLYFCQVQEESLFALARERSTAGGSPGAGEGGNAAAASAAASALLGRFSALAAELGVVLPVSFFERCGQAHFNTVVVFDADGEELGSYRKSHIPDGPGYQEKFYFSPGDTGFRVFQTAFGRVGVGICWDQWFPEAARVMALNGADILLYPTAIGSEPQDATLDSRHHWRTVMQGHAGANLCVLAAANREGVEQAMDGSDQTITFYGGSFVAGPTGELWDACAWYPRQPQDHDSQVEEEPEDGISLAIGQFDLARIRLQRASWGIFRDRRPELYDAIGSLDGGTRRGAR